MSEKIIIANYHHIDNGGVILSIIVKGIKDGIVLRTEACYHGNPAIITELPIDNYLGAKWLQNIGLMFIEAAGIYSKIDFEKRHNEKV